MACLEIKDLTFTYPAAAQEALKHISVTIEEGEFVLICGPSGSGKTTFLQQLKREIRPVGTRQGLIIYQQQSLDALPERQAAAEIGFVFQDPDNQLVMDNVWQELAFALENMGYAYEEMRKRIGEMVHFFGMEEWLHRPIEELSGGQKQMINLASVLLLQPKVLLLDEPTAQLDPVAAKEFLQLVGRINEEFSTTIIINEHRLEEIFPMASKVLMMDEGELVYQGTPRDLCEHVWSSQDEQWLAYLPTLSRVYLTTREQANSWSVKSIPLTVKEGRQWLSEEDISKSGTLVEQKNKSLLENALPILSCQEVSFQYVKGGRKILQHLDCQVQAGEIFSILGGNGAGKSTLLRIMLGLLRPQQGKVLYKQKSIYKLEEKDCFRHLGYVDQNPRLYFTYETLRECLQKRAEQLHLTNQEEKISELVDRLRLNSACLAQHPYDLSGGEQQKAALIMVLLAEPELLLLDEPTKGLDPHSKRNLGKMMQEWIRAGLTVILVSHDLEFVAEYANRSALLFDGQLTEPCTPQEFFSHNYFYTTIVQRVFRETLPSAITFEDVIQRWQQLRNGSILV